jgi:hypothetical protein
MDEKFVNLNDINFNNLNIIDNNESKYLEDITKTDIKIKSNDDENNPTLESENFPYSLSLKIIDFADEKDKKKFINTVKRLVRGSYEYSVWTKYLREILQYNNCALTNESGHELTVEIHHHPISLENIITAVLNKHILDGISFCSFDIAGEVIDLHYKMKIGVIPLITSLHEKFHNGFLNIPIELIKGDYKYIIDNYPLDEEVLELIELYESIHLKDCQLVWSATNTSE